jgi:hypothetical protein
VVEAQLKLLESNEGSLSGVPVIAVADVASKSGTGISQSSNAPAERSNRVFWPIIGGLAMVAAAVYVGLNRTTEAPVAPAPANAAPAPAQPSTPAGATVRFSISPPSARLYLDGAELPPGTAAKVLPADGSTHALRAEAEGHAPRSLEFTATGDLTVDLSLTPLSKAAAAAPEPKSASPRGVPRSRPVARPTAPAPVNSPAVTVAKPDCSSPFFLDSDGIKRVRPECR